MGNVMKGRHVTCEEFIRGAAVEVALTLPQNQQEIALRPELLEVGVQNLQNQLFTAGKKLADFRNAAANIREVKGEKAYSKLVQNRCGGEKALERVLFDDEWDSQVGVSNELFHSLKRHAGAGPKLLKCIDS